MELVMAAIAARCAVCGAQGDVLKKCGKCQLVFYCSREHQKSDYKFHKTSCKSPLLLSLPEEALLAVLAYLSPRDLFNCRVLCRRLRDVCLDRRLWQAADVADKGVLRAALNLAPCLRSARVPLHSLGIVASFVQSTACVVDELKLTVAEKDAAAATVILVKLSGLGGVRKLTVDIFDTPCQSLWTLLNAIYNVKGLKYLFIGNYTGQPLSAGLCDLQAKPSLTELRYMSFTVDPFLHLLLKTHSATLKEFHHLCENDKLGSLLAGIPSLRTLYVHYSSDDLAPLVALPNLERVILYSGETSPGTLQFLRGASQLRYVELHIPRHGPAPYLKALVQSPSTPNIKTLDLSGIWLRDVMKCLVPVLPRFTSLSSLTVDVEPTDDFLRAISCTSAPRLSTLTVRFFESVSCLHKWLHGPAIQDLLIRNPRLHLNHLGLYPLKVLKDCSCKWCKWGCHDKVMCQGSPRSYSSHVRRAGCPADCYQVVQWPGAPPLVN